MNITKYSEQFKGGRNIRISNKSNNNRRTWISTGFGFTALIYLIVTICTLLYIRLLTNCLR